MTATSDWQIKTLIAVKPNVFLWNGTMKTLGYQCPRGSHHNRFGYSGAKTGLSQFWAI